MFNAPHNPIQVLVDHADPLVAVGLSTVLAEHADLMVLKKGEAAVAAGSNLVLILDYDRALRTVRDRRAGLLPKALGLGRGLEARVLVVTSNDTEDEVMTALESGVEGYIELSCNVREIIEGVRSLARGSRYLCPMAASKVASGITRSPLTERETSVLHLVAAGKSNKAVGLQLNITPGTVKAHMKAILSKLNAQSRTEAATIARERGLVRSSGLSAGRA